MLAQTEDAIPYYQKLTVNNGDAPVWLRNFAHRQTCAVWRAARKEQLIDEYLESVVKENAADGETAWFRCEMAHSAIRKGSLEKAIEVRRVLFYEGCVCVCIGLVWFGMFSFSSFFFSRRFPLVKWHTHTRTVLACLLARSLQ